MSIAGEPTKLFLAAWQRAQLDLNAGIAAGISAFLVLCMDVASLPAAHRLPSMPRAARQGARRQVHMATILGADVFEAGTLVYMTWRYNPPALGVVWALVIARDIAAPLYAVYLSLAKPLPNGHVIVRRRRVWPALGLLHLPHRL